MERLLLSGVPHPHLLGVHHRALFLPSGADPLGVGGGRGASIGGCHLCLEPGSILHDSHERSEVDFARAVVLG